MNIKAKIEEIQKFTGIKVASYKIINRGAESIIIEINNEWIFRFPRNAIFQQKIEKRLRFLASFSKVSPLKIPNPKYIGNEFIGYKKLPGKPFYSTNFKKLSAKEKTNIAKQLGSFLKVLHTYKDRRINFPTGYLVMKREDYKVCPRIIAKYLNSNERKKLTMKLERIGTNPLNFKKAATIIHGDLNFNNILWDPDKKVITGIIDWAELGLGIPAMDFIMLADFNKNTNDEFLRGILKHYGNRRDNLFHQIKEDAIIDLMNWFWFYFEAKKLKKAAGAIKKLKKALV